MSDSPNGVNGHATPTDPTTNGIHTQADTAGAPVPETVDALKEELDRVRAEKDELTGQYSALVGKLNAMRTSVANKLKQDAEELDRREQLVQQLTTENEDLNSTVNTLQAELVASNADADRLARELDDIRSRALQQGAQEVAAREREIHDARAELERCRIERDDWARAAEQERVLKEEARESADLLRRDLEVERDSRSRLEEDLIAEREKVANLQSVLEDFQAAKEHELRQAVKDYDSQLTAVTQSLAEYKHRAHTAELRLEESSSNTSRSADLEKELKEKNLLIGKLRHEAVIINEHLNEALRRLRRQASDRDSTVDRRLVTNILLSFLTAPRGDSKRFEMLKILSDILSWNEAEREKAGLQRAGSGGSALSSPVMGRRPSQSASVDLEKSDVTESFSQMWVEFLLTQADDPGTGVPPPVPPSPTTLRSPMSAASSPPVMSRTLSSGSVGLGVPPAPAEGRRSGSWIRLPTFGSGTPSPPPVSEKGKERAHD